jgi:AhpD family alkylhydroperoxidase
VNIRVCQINGCAYCLHIHVRAALANGETAQRLAVLPAWRDTTLFTVAERASLTPAESLTTLPDARTQELDYAEATGHLTPRQLSALSRVVITMNAVQPDLDRQPTRGPLSGPHTPSGNHHQASQEPSRDHRARQSRQEPLRDS